MKTLNNELTFSGVGLHSGKLTSVTLSPTERDGIYFRTINGIFPISDVTIEENNRLTGFRLQDGTIVRTAEHMLSSILGMGLSAVEITLEGEEVPILDGSAKVFAEAILQTGMCDNGAIKPVRSISTPVCVADKHEEKIVSAFPSDTLKVTYVINYNNTPIGTQHISFEITPDVFFSQIAPARTFCLTSELDYLKKYGLAKGGSLENAIVFDENGPINEGGLRFFNECVTHKVVDILGDLALLGNVPIAHYVSICGGHAMHARLIDRIKRIYA